MEEVLLKRPEPDKIFGSAPIVFMNKEKEKEWENLPDNIKVSVLSNLEGFAQQMTHGASIQMLCHVINDLSKKISELEKALNEIRNVSES